MATVYDNFERSYSQKTILTFWPLVTLTLAKGHSNLTDWSPDQVEPFRKILLKNWSVVFLNIPVNRHNCDNVYTGCVSSFYRILRFTDRQTDKQTNTGKHIIPLRDDTNTERVYLQPWVRSAVRSRRLRGLSPTSRIYYVDFASSQQDQAPSASVPPTHSVSTTLAYICIYAN